MDNSVRFLSLTEKWRITGLKIIQLNTMRTKTDLCIQQVVWWILSCCKHVWDINKQLNACWLATYALHKHYAAYNCHQMIIVFLKISIHLAKHAWITETGVSRAISSGRAAFLCLPENSELKTFKLAYWIPKISPKTARFGRFAE